MYNTYDGACIQSMCNTPHSRAGSGEWGDFLGRGLQALAPDSRAFDLGPCPGPGLGPQPRAPVSRRLMATRAPGPGPHAPGSSSRPGRPGRPCGNKRGNATILGRCPMSHQLTLSPPPWRGCIGAHMDLQRQPKAPCNSATAGVLRYLGTQ